MLTEFELDVCFCLCCWNNCAACEVVVDAFFAGCMKLFFYGAYGSVDAYEELAKMGDFD